MKRTGGCDKRIFSLLYSMKIKKGFELRDICGEKVVIATGIENIDFGNMLSLNEVSALLFSKIKAGEQTLESLAAELCEEYEVEHEQALKDVTDFYEKLCALGIAE